MYLVSELFENQASSIDGVFMHVCKIFAAYWVPLTVISFLGLCTITGVFLILGGLTFAIFSKYIFHIVESIMDNMPNQGIMIHRNLLDFSLGVSGASRFLMGEEPRYQNKIPYIPPDGDGDSSVDIILAVLGMVVVWTVVLSLVTSTFEGATNHALGQIYAGSSPIPFQCIEHGYKNKWNLYFYQVLISFIVIFLAFVTLGTAPMMMANGTMTTDDFGAIVLGGLTYIVLMVLLRTLTVAAAPSIVIEGKSASQGLLRSLDLCRKFIFFIFCTQFVFNFCNFIVCLILSLTLWSRTGFIGSLLQVIVSISMGTLQSM